MARWCGRSAFCIGAALLLATAGAATRAASDLATKAMSVAALNTDPLAYYTDTLLRPGPARAAAGGGAQTPARVEPVSPETRVELTRIVGRSIANNSLSDPDKTYLASVVSQRTGLPQAEAEKRVADTYAEANRTIRARIESSVLRYKWLGPPAVCWRTCSD
jgi:hypothetical protein